MSALILSRIAGTKPYWPRIRGSLQSGPFSVKMLRSRGHENNAKKSRSGSTRA